MVLLMEKMVPSHLSARLRLMHAESDVCAAVRAVKVFYEFRGMGYFYPPIVGGDNDDTLSITSDEYIMKLSILLLLAALMTVSADSFRGDITPNVSSRRRARWRFTTSREKMTWRESSSRSIRTLAKPIARTMVIRSSPPPPPSPCTRPHCPIVPKACAKRTKDGCEVFVNKYCTEGGVCKVVSKE